MFDFTNTGSFWLLTPVTATAQVFTTQNLIHDETVEYGGGVVVEPRYVEDIAAMLEENGFTVIVNN